MPDPNSYQRVIRVKMLIVLGSVPTFGFGTPMFVSKFPASVAFPGREKAYAGSFGQVTQAILDDGFSETSPVYRMAGASLLSQPKIGEIYIGRQDELDASVTATMNAIVAENSDAWYPFAFDTREKNEIFELANWAEGRFHWYYGLTKDQDVINKVPGNIAELLNQSGFLHTALMYRDALSVAQAATVLTAAQTFSFFSGIVLSVAVDGGAPQAMSWVAAAASLEAANAQLYVFANGQNFLIAMNGGPQQNIVLNATPASNTALQAEPYPLAPGLTITAKADGGLVQVATILGTAGEQTSQNAEDFALADLDTLTMEADGIATPIVTFHAVDFIDITNAKAAEVASVINAQVPTVFAFDNGLGAVSIRSRTFGTASSMEITGGTANTVGKLNFPVVVDQGTGDAPDLAEMSAADLAIRLNADYTGMTADVNAGRIRLTSDTAGKKSQVQVVGGTGNPFVNFDATPIFGTGDADNIAAMTAAELAAKFSASLVGSKGSVNVDTVVITSTILGLQSSIEILGGTATPIAGFPLGLVQGTGDVNNIKQVTAQEIASKFNDVVLGAVAQLSGIKAKLSSNLKGDGSKLAFSGDAKNILQLPDQVVGLGTDEDYLECSHLGRCLVVDLDQEQTNWNNQAIPGRIGDPLREDQKNYLKSVSCNFLDKIGPQSVIRWGTMVKTEFYMDQRTTTDWVQARMTEAYNRWLTNNAEALKKIPYTQKGIDAAESVYRSVMERAESAQHVDERWRDLVNFPRRETVSVTDLNGRVLRGLKGGAFFVPGINEVEVTVTLQVG